MNRSVGAMRMDEVVAGTIMAAWEETNDQDGPRQTWCRCRRRTTMPSYSRRKEMQDGPCASRGHHRQSVLPMLGGSQRFACARGDPQSYLAIRRFLACIPTSPTHPTSMQPPLQRQRLVNGKKVMARCSNEMHGKEDEIFRNGREKILPKKVCVR